MNRILVYSRNLHFWHPSVVDGVRALRELGAEHGFTVDATEEPAVFRPETLRPYDAVVFLSTGLDVLDEAGRDALRTHLTDGHGWMGVHSAAASEPGWPWYDGLIGARFEGHPAIQRTTVEVADPSHPATAHLPGQWEWTDEWYNFRSDPRACGAHVLLTVDETGYQGGTMGPGHPLAWTGEHDGVPTFYTSLGHAPEAYADPAFRGHLLGGLRHVLGG